MQIRIQNGERGEWITASILAMIGCLFLSRALLSIGMLFFLGLTCVHGQIGQQLKTFVRTPLLLGLSLLFFIPLLSGLWSSDRQEWALLSRVKLPLLLFPLAFAGDWQLSQRQWRSCAFFLLAVVLAGTLWSTGLYLQQASFIHEQYLKAKTLRTPLDNDHVRFSWLVSACAGTLFLLLQDGTNRNLRLLLIGGAVWFTGYLHILSARTGLLSLYGFGFFLLVWLWQKREGRKLAAGLTAGVVFLPLLAWICLPTFRNRIRYHIYDFAYVRSGGYLPGANDGSRVFSLKGGWQILQEHPLGVGTGDIRHAMDRWYAAELPQIISTDKLYPSSEWLMYGGSAGWPGFLLFTAVMLVPFVTPVKRGRVFWYALNATAAFSFLFDIGLEGQYGVFLYAFFVLWLWKWLALPEAHRAE